VTRLLGIDLGTRRIGLAVADVDSSVVRPLATLRRSTSEREREAISRLLDEQGAEVIVIGLPLNMDGSEGDQARLTRAWAEEVLAPLGRPVCWQDERLTSERAALQLRPPRRGRAGGPPTAGQRSAHRAALDRRAAGLILEAVLAQRSVGHAPIVDGPRRVAPG
jgi:putative holliday junction resolvase